MCVVRRMGSGDACSVFFPGLDDGALEGTAGRFSNLDAWNSVGAVGAALMIRGKSDRLSDTADSGRRCNGGCDLGEAPGPACLMERPLPHIRPRPEVACCRRSARGARSDSPALRRPVPSRAGSSCLRL